MESSNVWTEVTKEIGVSQKNLHVPTSSATQDVSSHLMEPSVTATMDTNMTSTPSSVWTLTNVSNLDPVAKIVPILMAASHVPARKDTRRTSMELASPVKESQS